MVPIQGVGTSAGSDGWLLYAGLLWDRDGLGLSVLRVLHYPGWVVARTETEWLSLERWKRWPRWAIPIKARVNVDLAQNL